MVAVVLCTALGMFTCIAVLLTMPAMRMGELLSAR